MRIINIHQEHLIVCDNPECNYNIPNPTGDYNIDTSHYIDKPCPDCGDNLLTQKDHDDFERVRKIINAINKWFGWLSIFSFGKKRKESTLHVHKGIHINENKIK